MLGFLKLIEGNCLQTRRLVVNYSLESLVVDVRTWFEVQSWNGPSEIATD